MRRKHTKLLGEGLFTAKTDDEDELDVDLELDSDEKLDFDPFED